MTIIQFGMWIIILFSLYKIITIIQSANELEKKLYIWLLILGICLMFTDYYIPLSMLYFMGIITLMVEIEKAEGNSLEEDIGSESEM